MGAARACEDHMAMEEMLKNKEIVLCFWFWFLERTLQKCGIIL